MPHVVLPATFVPRTAFSIRHDYDYLRLVIRKRLRPFPLPSARCGSL